MEHNYQIEMDELAIGLTKPATKLGVPFIPFFLSIMTCFFGWMFYQGVSGSSSITGILFFVLLWVLCYGLMFFITSKDVFGLVIYWVNAQHFRRLPSHVYWGNTDSYQA